MLAITSLAVAGCDGPKQVVTRAIEAASEDGREAFLACFTKESRATLEMLWRERKIPLGRSDARVLEAQPIGQFGYLVQVQDGDGVFPLIVQTRAGVWRIDLLATEATLTDTRAPF